METENLVGKIAYYRPAHSREMISSEIVSIQKLINLAGNIMTIATMANGDQEAPSACYFELSNETAS